MGTPSIRNPDPLRFSQLVSDPFTPFRPFYYVRLSQLVICDLSSVAVRASRARRRSESYGSSIQATTSCRILAIGEALASSIDVNGAYPLF